MPSDKLHEECGVFGIYCNNSGRNVTALSYYALYGLQHRGQESCGIAVNKNGVIDGYRGRGLVNEVFTDECLEALGNGNMAIGHVRYGTFNDNTGRDSQPLVINHIKGNMAICDNGVLTNFAALRKQLELDGTIFRSTSGAEIIASVIIKERLKNCSIEQALCKAMYRLDGAYAILLMSAQKLIAARDPMGIKPLCMGRLGDDVVFASESCALACIGATFERDIEPGEIVVVSDGKVTSITEHCNKAKTALCVFEYVYFARPDSVIDGSSVHFARKKAGAVLAEDYPVEADVVIGVPDSGLDAAVGYAEKSGIPYGMGFIKNKYIGRTFIQPTQEDRANKVRIKLSVVEETVRDKRVVLIDDSIVRGTTCARIVKLLRESGAKEVHMRVTSPPFLHPCYYGTDIDSEDKLIATNHSIEEIRQHIGVDSLGYLKIERIDEIPENCKRNFCKACFTGEYPIMPEKCEDDCKYERQLLGDQQMLFK